MAISVMRPAHKACAVARAAWNRYHLREFGHFLQRPLRIQLIRTRAAATSKMNTDAWIADGRIALSFSCQNPRDTEDTVEKTKPQVRFRGQAAPQNPCTEEL
jgi:hypothetical protein